MTLAALFVLFGPLGAALLTLALPPRLDAVARWLCVAILAACTGTALWLCIQIVPTGLRWQGPHMPWLDLGPVVFGSGVFLDPMGAVMSALVCLLGTAVLTYTTWYLHDDPLQQRFYPMLGFFCSAMLGVVMADNLGMAFVCWELVGLGSYLLIGFWYFKPAVSDDPGYQRLKGGDGRGTIEHRLSPAHAQLKAFIMNRFGDAGFLAGIGLFLAAALSAPDHARDPLRWDALFALAHGGGLPGGMFGLTPSELLTLAGLCVFAGAMGKSAQFPLHTWLPDAMQGPTTASAIIHAATMVAAGVFLVARAYPLFTPDALTVVGWIGGITCLLAASIALVQWDLKAVLAYSTLSQLGLMFVALGAGPDCGGSAAAIAHLFTHAVFKCLLFLCAAAIIHGCNGCQDINRCGGLMRQMPVTAAVSLVGVLAIAGTPFFSASYSKDAVLAAALEHAHHAGSFAAWGPFLLACAGSLLTAAYMLRWWLRIFLKKGPSNTCCGLHQSPGHSHQHSHDPSLQAVIILVALTPLCLALPWTWSDWLHTALGASEHAHDYHHAAWLAFSLGTVGAVFAVIVYWWLPACRDIDAAGALNRLLRPVYHAATDLWGIDKLWNAIFVDGLGIGVGRLVARLDLGRKERLEALDGGGDPWFARRWCSIDGLIDGVGRACAGLGRVGGSFLDGRIGLYLAVTVITGAAILLVEALW